MKPAHSKLTAADVGTPASPDVSVRTGEAERPPLFGASEEFQRLFETPPCVGAASSPDAGSGVTGSVSTELPWIPPESGQLREGREKVLSKLNVPQVEAHSSDEAVDLYVRLSALKKPPSVELVVIVGTDVAPVPQGGMTFLQIDSAEFVVDSRRNEDGYKFIARIAAAIGDAGFQVTTERSEALVEGPAIARVRIRRS